MSWYLAVLRNWAVIQGRSRRKEYWMFYLINLLVIFVLLIIDGAIGTRVGYLGILTGLYLLYVFLPSIAVGVRPLHNTGRSGWWLLIIRVPLVGPIVLLVFNVQVGAPGDNEYGPNPKTARA